MNSYTALYEQRTNLKNAVNELGLGLVAESVFYSYLHANHLHDSWDSKSFNRMLDGRKLSEKQLKTLKFITSICFNLDEEFLRVTTVFYMKLNSKESKLSALNEQDYLSVFEKKTPYKSLVRRLVEIISN